MIHPCENPYTVLQQQNNTSSVKSECSVLCSQRDNVNPLNLEQKMRVGFPSGKMFQDKQITSWSRECHGYQKLHV